MQQCQYVINFAVECRLQNKIEAKMITIFCIKPQGFNVGNEIIFLGMQHFLFKTFGGMVNLISLPATSVHESYSKAGLTRKTVYEINQYGDGVIVGGGNLYENGELDVDIGGLDKLEVPLMLFSLSKGRIFNRQRRLVHRTDTMPDEIIRMLNKKASYSLTRDFATTEYLRKIGCDNVIIGGCPTIFLDRMENRLPELFKEDQATAIISIRHPNQMNIPLRYQAGLRNDIVRIINLLRDSGYENVRLLCHDHRDIPFAVSFENVDYMYTGDVYALLAILKSSAIHISYRLHGTLPCLSFGTASISISYDERAISLMETIDMAEWDINMLETDDVVKEVADRLSRLKDLYVIRRKAKQRWEELYNVMLNTFKDFAKEVTDYHEGTR